MASLHGVIRAIQPLSIRDTRIPTTISFLDAYPYFYNS